MTPTTARIILGVSETTSQEEIKQAYRGRIRLTHPDRFPPGSQDWENANKMQRELNEAYDVLRYFDGAYKRREEAQTQHDTNARDPKEPLPAYTLVKYWLIIIGPLILAVLLRIRFPPRIAGLFYFLIIPLLIYISQSAKISLYKRTRKRKG